MGRHRLQDKIIKFRVFFFKSKPQMQTPQAAEDAKQQAEVKAAEVAPKPKVANAAIAKNM
jgi:hypothetical protein